MPRIHKDHVSKNGDTIEEINAKSGIDELLYQGDIVLTELVLEMYTRQLGKDDVRCSFQLNEVVEEVEGVKRGKRQAFRDRNYPNTLWSKGVMFSFGNASNVYIVFFFAMKI